MSAKSKGKNLVHVGQKLRTLVIVMVKRYLELFVAATVIHVCITKTEGKKNHRFLVKCK